MKVIGLAGEAGCGKSAVAHKLSQQDDVTYVDLDKIAWQTYRPCTLVYRQLIARYGNQILRSDGAISRGELGKIVFSDAKALDDLNTIVHPAVNNHLRRIIDSEKARGMELVVVEGALLASSPYVDNSLFDVVIWLKATLKTRAKRLRTAGRAKHGERSAPRPERSNVVTVSAEGTVDLIADQILKVIRSLGH
ncbi:MAG: dephospho-CoA kinase, partial [Candidatus Bipolaricaulota bacterium]